MPHLPALDELRGVAVLLVLVFHFAWAFPEHGPLTTAVRGALWTGWIGVDLFFVLSGYLITRGLAASSERPVGERLRLFWMRRVLRIFPLYFVALGVGSLAAGLAGGAPPGWPYWLYVQNYALAFDPFHVVRWTSHFWSLAVEEQFYVLWPVVVLLTPARSRGLVTAGAIVLGAALRTYLVLRTPLGAEVSAKMAYVAMPTRMDGLLLGALLALAETGQGFRGLDDALRNVRLRRAILALSGVAVVGLAVWTRGLSPYDRRVAVLGFPLLAVTFALLVSAARSVQRTRGPVARALAACGRVSYGMYVLHWPLVVLTLPALEALHRRLPVAVSVVLVVGVIAVGIVVSYALAVVSFRYVEGPFLRRKHRFSEGPGAGRAPGASAGSGELGAPAHPELAIRAGDLVRDGALRGRA